MRRVAGAGLDRGYRDVEVGTGVSQRDAVTSLNEGPYEIETTGQFRCQRHDANVRS